MSLFEMIASAVLLAVCGFMLRELREFKDSMAKEIRTLNQTLMDISIRSTELGGLVENLNNEIGIRFQSAEREDARLEQNDKELFGRVRELENTVRAAPRAPRKQ